MKNVNFKFENASFDYSFNDLDLAPFKRLGFVTF